MGSDQEPGPSSGIFKAGKLARPKTRTIEHCHIYKRYHDGAFAVKNLDPHTGKTVSSYYNNGRGTVFFYDYVDRTWFHHNLRTGIRVTTLANGKKKIQKSKHI